MRRERKDIRCLYEMQRCTKQDHDAISSTQRQLFPIALIARTLKPSFMEKAGDTKKLKDNKGKDLMPLPEY